MVSVPSIIMLVRLATVPSNASFSGALASRAFRPERSPDKRGDEVAGADRAVDALAAPVELPGRGKGTRDRRPGQRKVDVVERSRRRDWRRPHKSSTPSWIRISENDTGLSAPGFMVRAMVSMNGVQLLSPSACAHDMDLRTQHHDVGDLEPLQQQRQQPQIRGQHVDRAARGRRRRRPSARRHERRHSSPGNTETSIGPLITRSRPVTARICASTAGAKRVPVEEPGGRDQADQHHAEQRRDRRPQALHSLGHRQ